MVLTLPTIIAKLHCRVAIPKFCPFGHFHVNSERRNSTESWSMYDGRLTVDKAGKIGIEVNQSSLAIDPLTHVLAKITRQKLAAALD